MVIRRFPIRFTGLNTLMVLLGIRRRTSYVDIEPEMLHVRMGWTFALTVPLSSVRSATDDHGRVLGWGVHGWRGEWLVNGSSSGIVRIELAPAGLGRVLVAPVRVRVLRVAVEDPAGLIGELSA